MWMAASRLRSESRSQPTWRRGRSLDIVVRELVAPRPVPGMNACISASSACTTCWRSCAAQTLSRSRIVTVPNSGWWLLRSRSVGVSSASNASLSRRRAANAAISSRGVRSGSGSRGASGSYGVSCWRPSSRCRTLTGITRRSTVSKWRRHSAADHAPGAGGRSKARWGSRSRGSAISPRWSIKPGGPHPEHHSSHFSTSESGQDRSAFRTPRGRCGSP